MYFSSNVFRDALFCFYHFKRPYDLVSKVLNHKEWENLLKQNFQKFYTKLKEKELFMINMFCFILIINFFLPLCFIYCYFLYSIIFCFWSCDFISDGTYVDQTCEQCSLIYPHIFDMHNIFQGVIIDERDSTDDLDKLFCKRSLMNLDVFHTGTFFNKRFRDKTTSCQNFISISGPRSLFNKFLSILLRIF